MFLTLCLMSLVFCQYMVVRNCLQVYKEVCAACHSMKFLYFRQLVGTVMTEAEAKAEAEEVIDLNRLSPTLSCSVHRHLLSFVIALFAVRTLVVMIMCYVVTVCVVGCPSASSIVSIVTCCQVCCGSIVIRTS